METVFRCSIGGASDTIVVSTSYVVASSLLKSTAEVVWQRSFRYGDSYT
uniref:Uncharacterized protein n=1 Tax=Anguilla anguilla TaxID=7936 RepID=A0A0E9X1Q6_ANGAN